MATVQDDVVEREAIRFTLHCRLRWWPGRGSAFSTSFEGLVCTNAGRALMPYHLYGDELAGDARWDVLAEGDEGPSMTQRRYESRLDTLQAAFFRMNQHAAHQRDDGYIGHRAALKACHGKPWVLTALLTPACGKGPLVHTKGDTCGVRNCIDKSPPWVEGFEYRICGFLKKNPSRKEKERNEAQKRDLDDATLRAYLFDRDGACCRYCRSGPLKRKGMGNAKDRRRIAVVEHVDPDRDAGADRSNAVLACAACNEFKGRCTPDEAGMVLLPEPSPELIAWWQQRGEQQFDRPENGEQSPADNRPDNASDKPPDNAPDNPEGFVEGVVSGVVQGVVGAVVDGQETAGGGQEQAQDNPSEGSGSGRVGQRPSAPVSGPLGQPIRAPDAPDIYHRRSRAPDPVAGPP